MNTWAPLWSGIVESSLWEESGDVVKVFMTMLARKDSDHVCTLNSYKIHKICNIDELEVMDILKVLASPDKRRKSKQEYEGRRIQAVEDGWLILNGKKYRDMVSYEMRKARWRRAQENSRAKKAGEPLPYPSQKKPYVEGQDEKKAHDAVQTAVVNLGEVQRRAEEEANENG